MFGKTKAIYEARIAELKASHERELVSLREHISSLQRLVFPPTTVSIPDVQLEADSVLSVREEVIQLTDTELKQREDAMAERDRLLSGQY